MNPQIKGIAAVGIFSAMAFVGGYLFLFVPNVEIFTAVVFLSGIFMGSKKGVLVGVIARALFSILNPVGISPPPLFIAQIAGMAFVGYVGGRFGNLLHMERRLWMTALYFGIAALLVTWLYDILTDFSSFFQSGFSFKQMIITFSLGIPFYLIHGIGNSLIFALVLPLVVRRIQKVEIVKQTNLS